MAGAERKAPSLLRRATQAVWRQLELGDGTSAAHRHAPPAPSHWSDAAHRRHLVRIWDRVADVTATSSNPHTPSSSSSIAAQLLGTQHAMIHHFPELGHGPAPLTREWIEYVLGLALRHPFCTHETMGRWEILASSGSPRMNWGPW